MTEKTAPKIKKPVVKKKTSRKKKEEVKNEEVPEQHQLLDILESSFYNIEGRTKEDRRREFREVFLGSDTGKRVLYEILGMAKLSARLVAPFPAPIDEKRMLVLEGARQLAADILLVIQKEVNTELPSKTTNKES